MEIGSQFVYDHAHNHQTKPHIQTTVSNKFPNPQPPKNRVEIDKL